ncbi:hypothetical protein GCM10010350_76790 [Streptomyces galilaeus]|nr:hypothetical protein GCM10010350_76790 [Streptomyces galilaeus]
MACDEDRGWSETPITGLQVRADGAAGMRLLGWEGVLPLSVIRSVVGHATPTPEGSPAPAPALADGTSPRRKDSQPKLAYGPKPRSSPGPWGRKADKIRRELQKAGCTEFSDREDGFAVDGGQDGAPFLVACTIGEWTAAKRELLRYRQALTGAGLHVASHPRDRGTLLVRIPSTG